MSRQLRITPDHFQLLSTAIGYVTKNKHPFNHNLYREACNSDAEYRWDLFWNADINRGMLQSYLTDSQIDTALCRITETS